MRVLQINAVYSYASTGRTTKELHEALLSNNIDSYAAISDMAKSDVYTYKIGNDFDTKLHALMSRLAGKQAYFSHIATLNLMRYISKIRPDIIHIRNLHANYIHLNMLLKYAAKKDIAVVLTLHDCWFYTGKCTHYTMAGCYKWQTGCYNCPRLKYDNKSWFFDRTKKMWRDKNKHFNRIPRLGVIGVSDWITNEAKKSYLKDAAIIQRIYNWIDLDVFKPKSDDILKKYNIPQNKFNIIVVGAGWKENTSKYKDLIKLSKLITDDMQIILVGSCENEIPDNIIKTGYVNGTNDLASLYSAADVYVHLSREDTFGKVVAEAMACGTPAIVYNSTALPELIGEGCGYVVDNENVNQIYEKVTEIKHTGKSFYSDFCIKHTRNNFDKEKLIYDTIKLYQKLCDMEEK